MNNQDNPPQTYPLANYSRQSLNRLPSQMILGCVKLTIKTKQHTHRDTHIPHILTYTHTQIHILTCTHSHIHTHIQRHTHAHINIYTQRHTNRHTQIYIHTTSHTLPHLLGRFNKYLQTPNKKLTTERISPKPGLMS